MSRNLLADLEAIDVESADLISHNSLFSHLQVEAEALHGPVGDVVRAIEPHTEADRVAILIQTLVGFGNLVGRNAFFRVEADKHHLNLFVVLVGDSSKARKGTSWGHAKRVLAAIDPYWSDTCITGGLASGEGLVWEVRDDFTDHNGVVLEAGAPDKRLLVVEPEFGRVLAVSTRDSNTLSAIVRESWDTGNLRTMSKKAAGRATGAHISITGHITRSELLRLLDDTQKANGFGNRFLWLSVKRSKLLPEGGAFHQVDLQRLVEPLKRAAEFAQTVGEIRRDEGARRLWYDVYPALSEGADTLVGHLTNRAEAQVTRLSALYAVLDCSRLVRVEHLTAALALWKYCEASAEAVFGDALGDPVADSILSTIRMAGADGATRTDLSNSLGRHQKKTGIDLALKALQRVGLIERTTIETGGRPAECWIATSKCEKSEESEIRGGK